MKDCWYLMNARIIRQVYVLGSRCSENLEEVLIFH